MSNDPASTADAIPAIAEWERAATRLRDLLAAESCHPYDEALTSDPSFGEIKADHGKLVRELREGFEAVISTPAPSLAAVGEKIGLIVEYADGTSLEAEWFEPVPADIAALDARAARH